jgi:hypothetical protein
VGSCNYSSAFPELEMRTREELFHCDSEMNERVWKTRLLGALEGWAVWDCLFAVVVPEKGKELRKETDDCGHREGNLALSHRHFVTASDGPRTDLLCILLLLRARLGFGVRFTFLM